MGTAQTRLIFVYNANSGLAEAIRHAFHKQLFPASYPCSLCALTFGLVSMRGEWKRHWQALDVKVVFHHRDDFTAAYPMLGTGGEREVALPCVLLGEGGDEPRVLIAKAELDAMTGLGDLIGALRQRLPACITRGQAGIQAV
jgi:hypothetical protein